MEKNKNDSMLDKIAQGLSKINGIGYDANNNIANNTTGNSFLDNNLNGGLTKNSEYNPKTKKGRQQPKYINASIGDINNGFLAKTANGSENLYYTIGDNGRSLEDIQKEEDEFGWTYSRFDDDEELNKSKAENQSAMQQFGNFLVQAGLGEFVLGSLEGFSNIFDGIVNSFTDEYNEQNFFGKYMNDLQNKVKDNFAIYRANPDKSFDLTDTGWWFDNAVSIASTLSLMIPAAGWARAVGYLGKISRLNKLASGITRGVSRGLARQTARLNPKTFNNLDKVAKANAIDSKAALYYNRARDFGKYAATSYFSRTGENYMESTSVYEQNYTDIKDKLNSMSDEEFKRFQVYSKFNGLSKDEIARKIAGEAANKTFWNNYWMLATDIIQYRALGKLLGKGRNRTPKGEELIAKNNAKLKLAGTADDKLIKNTFINRQKENIKYAFKNPSNNPFLIELTEAGEEIFQGIQTEKGNEVAQYYLDDDFTPRSLSSYLIDSHIWEQGFWGYIGGLGFKAGGSAYNNISKKIKDTKMKKTLSPEEYERWKNSDDKIAINQMNNITNNAITLTNELDDIENGKNPYKYKFDPITGNRLVVDGKLQQEEINDEEKTFLRDYAIKKFTDNVALQGVDLGTYDMFKEIFTSKEMEKFLSDKGYASSSAEKALQQEIVKRLDEVADLYTSELNNIDAINDSENPYVTIATARYITRQKIDLQNAEQQYNTATANLANQQLDENDENYKELAELSRTIDEYKAVLEEFQQVINLDQNDNTHASKIAKNHILNDLLKRLGRDEHLNDNDNAARTDVRNKLRERLAELEEEFKEKYYDYIPNAETKKVIDDYISAKHYYERLNNTSIHSNDEYKKIYEEIANGMDKVRINRMQGYLKDIAKFLEDAENEDDLVDKKYKIISGKTGDDTLDDKVKAIRFGYYYQDSDNPANIEQMVLNAGVRKIFEDADKQFKKKKEIKKEAKELEVPNIDTNTSTGDLTQADTQNNEDSNEQENVQSNNNSNKQVNKEDEEHKEPAKVNLSELTVEKVLNEGKDDRNEVDKVDTSGIGNEKTEEISIDASGLEEDFNNDLAIAVRGQLKTIFIKKVTSNPQNTANTDIDTLIEEIFNDIINERIKYTGNEKDSIITFINNNRNDTRFKDYVKTVIESTKNEIKRFTNSSENIKQYFYLANGVSTKSSNANELNASTGNISNEGLNEAVESFLEWFIKDKEIVAVDGQPIVINIEDIFNELLDQNSVFSADFINNVYNNLFSYINNVSSSKYIFTGYNTIDRSLTADKFITMLKQARVTTEQLSEKMHLARSNNPIDPYLYEEAILAAANQQGEIFAEYSSPSIDEKIPSISIKIKFKRKNGKDKNDKDIIQDTVVELGYLRTVESSKNGAEYSTTTFGQGFNFTVSKNSNNNYTLNIDDVFEELIDGKTPAAKELLEIVIEHAIASEKLANGTANTNDVVEQNIDRLKSNPLINKLIKEGMYATVDDGTDDYMDSLITGISNIILYRQSMYGRGGVNDIIKSLNTSKKVIKIRYNTFRKKVYTNFSQTYEIQKVLSTADGTKKLNVDITAQIYETLNVLPKNKLINIKDAAIDSTKHKLLIVNKNGILVDEDGNTYGFPNSGIGSYSMGYLVYSDKDVNHVAYLTTANSLPKNSPLIEDIRFFIQKLIYDRINENTNDINQLHTNYENIARNLNELFFEKNSLFRFPNIMVSVAQSPNKTAESSNIITIKNKKTGRNLITFYRYGADGHETNNVIIYPQEGDVAESNTKGIKVTNETFKLDNPAKPILEKVLEDITENVYINKSMTGFTGKKGNGSTSNLFTKTNDKFILKLGRNERLYDSYGDFILQSDGFTTNVDGNKGFIVSRINNSFGLVVDIDTIPEIKEARKNDVVAKVNEATGKTKKGDYARTLPTEQLFSIVGYDIKENPNIDGINLFTKNVIIDDKDNNETDSKRLAYFRTSDNSIHITPLGLNVMAEKPHESYRLILHENIHRFLHNKKVLNQKEYNKVITELKEVYEYTLQKLNEDYDNGAIDDAFYSSTRNVIDTINSYSTDEVRMEEFLVECLSQKHLIKYLNNTNYKHDVIVSTNNKSIFQKLIDIILKLFDLDVTPKNNSILAKQYMLFANIKPADKKSDTSKNKTKVKHKQDNTTIYKETNVDETKNKSSNKKTNNKPPVEESFDNNPATNNQSADKSSDNNKPVSDNPVFNNTNESESDNNDVDKTQKKLKVVKDNFQEVINTFNSRVKRHSDFFNNHSYYLDSTSSKPEEDGKKIDVSVTTLVHGKQDIGVYGTPASTLGNTFDEAARIFFNSTREEFLDYLKTVPNHNDSQKSILLNTLTNIRKALDKEFGEGNYGVITEEFPIAGTVVLSDGKEKLIAGTPDMVVYDKDGNIYIYDFKTHRANNNPGLKEETKEGYFEQVNIYRQLIIANFPELKDKVHVKQLIVAETVYPDPNEHKYVAEDGQLKIDGKDIQELSEDEYIPPFLDSLTGEDEWLVDIPTIDKIRDFEFNSLPSNSSNDYTIDSEGKITKEDDSVDESLLKELAELEEKVDEVYEEEEYEDMNIDMLAATNRIVDKHDNLTNAEIFAQNIDKGEITNPFGVIITNDMQSYTDTFSLKNRADLANLLASDSVNYTCK